jgi:hypothetical protein
LSAADAVAVAMTVEVIVTVPPLTVLVTIAGPHASGASGASDSPGAEGAVGAVGATSVGAAGFESSGVAIVGAAGTSGVSAGILYTGAGLTTLVGAATCDVGAELFEYMYGQLIVGAADLGVATGMTMDVPTLVGSSGAGGTIEPRGASRSLPLFGGPLKSPEEQCAWMSLHLFCQSVQPAPPVGGCIDQQTLP